MRIILYILFSLIIYSPGWSQKQSVSKKKKDKKEKGTEQQLSEEDQIKMEATLIEAEKQLVLDNYGKATELFQVVLDIDPDNAAANFKLAETLTKTGRMNDALAYATAALNLDRSNKYYYLLTAEIYKAQGDLETAADLYAEMIDKVPDTDSYLYDLAVLYQYLEKYDLALSTYKKADEKFGMNEMALREKQKIYLAKRDYQSLIEDWDQLIKENPDETDFTIELTQFLINQGMIDEAEKRLENVVIDQAQRNLLQSEIEMRRGNNETAMKLAAEAFESPTLNFEAKIQILNTYLEQAITPEQFESAIEMATSLGDTYEDKFEAQAYAGDVLYRMTAKQQAKYYYLRALKINPDNYSVWQNILNIESELNQYDSLVMHADEALEYFPNQAILYYFSGTGHLILKDYKKSIQMLNAGTKYATEPGILTIFYGQLGDAYNSLKNKKKSYESYELALENNPTNDHVLNNYSYYLSLDKSDLEKALEMSTKLIQLVPDNPTYMDTHGWVLYTLGKYEEALGFLEKAAKLDKNGTIIEHYGDVLYQLGREEEAVKQWEKASSLDDASENIEKKIAERKLYE
ncbi:tetratricopeptide repeat protein [Marinoscillum sp. MHG1-6]|uniref:tetratricopeptide repeat protein n=1 Tax=Marinoscillum sp. MHG1-6 TaxID=2959627 RepID=UPI0021573C72|nr:tetratricopeptide repeat protein [Marinoscillum sp. MHG1-6]